MLIFIAQGLQENNLNSIANFVEGLQHVNWFIQCWLDILTSVEPCMWPYVCIYPTVEPVWNDHLFIECISM